MDQASLICEIDLNLEQSSELFKDDTGEEPGIVGGPQEADEPQMLNDVEIMENVPENVPLIPLEKISECVPENVLESVPESVPESVSKDLPECVPEIISEKVPDNIPNTVAALHETILESVQEMVSEIVSEKISEHSEEPEEGEISDDNEQVIGDHDECVGIPSSLEKDESSSMQKKEFDPSSSKSSASGPFVRWPNGDAMKFYQHAWAQGVQGILKESPGDSPLEDTASMKGKKSGDSDSPSVPTERSASWTIQKLD